MDTSFGGKHNLDLWNNTLDFQLSELVRQHKFDFEKIANELGLDEEQVRVHWTFMHYQKLLPKEERYVRLYKHDYSPEPCYRQPEFPRAGVSGPGWPYYIEVPEHPAIPEKPAETQMQKKVIKPIEKPTFDIAQYQTENDEDPVELVRASSVQVAIPQLDLEGEEDEEIMDFGSLDLATLRASMSETPALNKSSSSEEEEGDFFAGQRESLRDREYEVELPLRQERVLESDSDEDDSQEEEKEEKEIDHDAPLPSEAKWKEIRAIRAHLEEQRRLAIEDATLRRVNKRMRDKKYAAS